MTYVQHMANTPQTEQADPRQVQNNAGGFTFALDKWKRLDRWLILGAEGGTYYVSERKLTRDNAKSILECLKEDGARTVARIVEISEAGRAPKNDPAVFALALAAADESPATKAAAYAALPRVCRIGTHLFQFVEAVDALRGWGRGLRGAVAKWYEGKEPKDLAYQVAKYQARGGWSHRDVLRLAHLTPSAERQAIYRWIVERGETGEREVKRKGAEPVKYPAVGALPPMLQAIEELRGVDDVKRVCELVRAHRLPFEVLDGKWLAQADVWRALSEHMPLGALIRNLGKLTAVGVIKPLGAEALAIAEKLASREQLKKARVHPLALLSALRVYQQGHGDKGKLSWSAHQQVVDALNEAFYLAFETIVPTGKAHMLAIDISGSMGAPLSGVPGVSCREAAATLAMVTAREEANSYAVGFHAAPGTSYRYLHQQGTSTVLVELPISAKMRLDDVVRVLSNQNFGQTDCSLPMLGAMQLGLEVDAFCVYTDNETYAGKVHPHEALKQYRQKTGRNAKLAVVGMTSTGFTIADPSDAGMMDFVGFDTAAPSVLADFVRG